MPILVTKNSTPYSPRVFGKIFDVGSSRVVSEPEQPIDPSIDYRSMSIQSQMENGILDDNVDMSNFASNPLDMSDSVTRFAEFMNKKLDDYQLSAEDRKRTEEFINSLSSSSAEQKEKDLLNSQNN